MNKAMKSLSFIYYNWQIEERTEKYYVHIPIDYLVPAGVLLAVNISMNNG